jgi:hypothetical protein
MFRVLKKCRSKNQGTKTIEKETATFNDLIIFTRKLSRMDLNVSYVESHVQQTEPHGVTL